MSFGSATSSFSSGSNESARIRAIRERTGWIIAVSTGANLVLAGVVWFAQVSGIWFAPAAVVVLAAAILYAAYA
jgi:hypothetical protein